MLKSTLENVEKLSKAAEQFGYKIDEGFAPHIRFNPDSEYFSGKNMYLMTELVIEMDSELENIKGVNVAFCGFGTRPEDEDEIFEGIVQAKKCADKLNQIIGRKKNMKWFKVNFEYEANGKNDWGTIVTVANGNIEAENEMCEFLSIWLDGDEEFTVDGKIIKPVFTGVMSSYRFEYEDKTIEKLYASLMEREAHQEYLHKFITL